MASRSNLVCYNVESINLWVGLGWVATKYGMLVTVPVVTTEDFMTHDGACSNLLHCIVYTAKIHTLFCLWAIIIMSNPYCRK